MKSIIIFLITTQFILQGCIGLKGELPEDLKTSTLYVVEDKRLTDSKLFERWQGRLIAKASKKLVEKFKSYPYKYKIIPISQSTEMNELMYADNDTGHIYFLRSGVSPMVGIQYSNGKIGGTYTEVILKNESTGEEIVLMKAKNGLYGGAGLFVRKVNSMK